MKDAPFDLEVLGATYVYADGTAALSKVSFTVSPGEVIGLVGPSGAGKSTLLMALLGLLRLQRGEVRIGGTTLAPRSQKALRQRVGLVFQNPDDQLFMPTLFDDVAFGLRQQGVAGEEIERRVQKVLADRGLDGLGKKFPGHLSGGQKRLASLGAVLVMEPQILLLDEPSSNLDPRSRRQLISQLAALETTQLIATHDLEMVIELCTRVLVLDEGQLIAKGAPRVVLGDASLMEAHSLEVPHSLLPHGSPHPMNRPG
jgi:cobalt/nickel transport system ATP-binding protein